MPVALFNNDPIGPTVEIGIAPHSPSDIAGVPPPTTVWIKAIADTGCTHTSICAAAAARASLPVIGIGQMTTASHTIPANLYFGTLWVRGMVTGTTSFAWNFPARTFIELGLPGASHEALLGMDIISLGIMVVNGSEKKTTFAW
jgi:hypothetical protein